MYYEKKLLPISKEGHFLLAVHYPRHKIGGECTRESMHAYFAYGHIDGLKNLKEITSLCCLERKSSPREAEHFRKISEVQKNMVGNQKAAWQYAYQASLAQKDSLFVPRTVLASLEGTLIIGIEGENAPDTSSATLRAINIFNEAILAEHQESAWPEAKSVAYPNAISSDGKSIITINVSDRNNMAFVEKQLANLKPKAIFRQPMLTATFLAAEGRWIAADQDNVFIFKGGDSKPINQDKMPKGVFPWTAEISFKGNLVAFAGNKGLISTLNLATGEIKKYFPHRGSKRDDFAQVKLSVNGDWMASRIHHKKELIITRLEDGKSWKVAEVCDQLIIEREEEKYQAKSHIIAAFAFIGSKLLVSDTNEVREVAIQEPESKELVFVSEQGKPGARVPLKISPKATLEKVIKAAKLDRHQEEIEAYYSQAVKLKTKKSKKSGWSLPDKRGAPELGVSRFGGWPDLPIGVDWPTWDGRPMCFLAQINLEEIHKVQPNIRLPKQGLLLFFVGCNEETYKNEEVKRETYMLDIMVGFESKTNDAWKVIYAKSNKELQRTIFAGHIAPELFSPCLLKISCGGMPFPHEFTAAYDQLAFNQAERDNFNEVLDLLSEEYPENQLMGYPNLLQFTPPELQCVLASLGKNPFDFPEEGSSEYEELLKDASEWGLLLQLTSDDNANFMWGDAGHLYFYGKRSEMESGDFTNIWINYEC